MTKYKALMLDLDGTTIPNRLDGMPSPKVTEAISKARKRIHVCIATSRPLLDALHIIKYLGITDPCIVNGGAQVYDPVSGKTLWEQPLETTDIVLLFQLAKDLQNDFDYSDDVMQSTHDNTKLPKKALDFFFRGFSDEEANEFITKLSHVSTLSFHKITSWNKGETCVKVSHAAATKQHGIVKVAEIIGVSHSEMIGVGDGYNDFPLLMACGLKVAMGNAVPDLKAIADYIAPTVADDGVADVIEKFIL